MKPFDLYRLHQRSKTSYRKDVILDLVNEHPTVINLLDYCGSIGVGSQATLHKDLHELIDAGYVSKRVSSIDKRVVILKLTVKSKDYLRKL